MAGNDAVGFYSGVDTVAFPRVQTTNALIAQMNRWSIGHVVISNKDFESGTVDEQMIEELVQNGYLHQVIFDEGNLTSSVRAFALTKKIMEGEDEGN